LEPNNHGFNKYIIEFVSQYIGFSQTEDLKIFLLNPKGYWASADFLFGYNMLTLRRRKWPDLGFLLNNLMLNPFNANRPTDIQ
jgi:hypothetical protein